ncbi:MAG: hypothetical protein U0Q18_18720 [Bryobacteraceae bacterium]
MTVIAERDFGGRKEQERLRRSYRPNKVRLLFVGESPPASGRFFYQGDSGLYRAILRAFQRVDPSIDGANFLAKFRDAGCYLVDLCPAPVDDLDPKPRREACRAAEAALSRAIARLRPLIIVTVVRSIENNVIRSADGAGWHGTFVNLPYPGRWSRYRDQFVDTLAEICAAEV